MATEVGRRKGAAPGAQTSPPRLANLAGGEWRGAGGGGGGGGGPASGRPPPPAPPPPPAGGGGGGAAAPPPPAGQRWRRRSPLPAALCRDGGRSPRSTAPARCCAYERSC